MDLNNILELEPTDPYANGRVLRFEDGSVTLERPILNYIPSNKDRYYTIIEGDTLLTIANEAYGDVSLYYVIADVNGIIMPLELEVGTTLIIPDIETTLNHPSNKL